MPESTANANLKGRCDLHPARNPTRSMQAVLSNELFRALEPVRRLPATLAAALPVTDVTALQRGPAMPASSGYALPPGPSPQVCTSVTSSKRLNRNLRRYGILGITPAAGTLLLM